MKLKKSSFIEGTFIATFAIIVTKILGMLYVIPFYQIVGSEGASLYAYAYNIYVIFLDISTAGIPLGIAKLIQEFDTLNMLEAKNRTYKLGKYIILIISIISFLVLIFNANILSKMILGNMTGGNTVRDVSFVIRVIALSLLIVPFLSVVKGYLQGHKIINVVSFSQVIEQIIRIVIILLGSYLTINVLRLRYVIGITLLGAFLGGLGAYIYLNKKIRLNKCKLGLNNIYQHDKITNKEIIIKLIKYAVPFIIVSTCISLYNFINMVFISRTLIYLDYPASMVEFITTSITTWEPKINMIVTSLGTGMTISLIPTIVEAFTLRKFNIVNEKFNKAIEIVLFISLPAVIGIMILAKPIWTVFYGKNILGTNILCCSIIIAVLENIFLVSLSTLQGLNCFKIVYKSTIFGLGINMLLDIPLMMLFNYFNIVYIGAIVSTIIGYLVSIFIALISLKKKFKLNYQKTISLFFKIFFSLGIMVVVIYILKLFIPYVDNKIYLIIYIGVISIIGALVYLIVSYYLGIINSIFGNINQLIKKLTFGKL